ncbi:MAG TPA: hypothetical protein VFC39_04930 [Acidobacteriaceae bacterium]|nr:hypothetical protein [Acidobacteriaceae bacterium]
MTSISFAQTTSPTMTHKLQAQKEPHLSNCVFSSSTVLYLTPDQALLAVIPQPDNIWLFKRITAWETGAPKEETLTFTVKPLEKRAKLSYLAFECPVRTRFATLDVDPEQHLAVFRLKSDSGATNNTAKWTRSAEIVVVDLRTFTIVSQQDTTDPLLASSAWAFADNGMLIASALTERTTSPPKPKLMGAYDTITEHYEAVAFTLPQFTSSMECENTRFIDFRDAKFKHNWQLTKVSDGCASLVALAQVPEADNLPDGPPKPQPYAKLAGPTCRISDKSPTSGYMLYDCRTAYDGLDGMIDITTSRKLTVLKIPGGQAALDLRLPRNSKPYPALLANTADHTWLLLLRDGINLDIYRVP